MKVCLLADAQSVHIQQLAPRLAGEGVDVHVVTHKPAPLPGCTVERFRVPGVGPTNMRRWEGRRRNYLRSILRRFDVVNMHFLQDWGLLTGDGELFGDGCLVMTPWGSDIVDPPGETPASPHLIQTRREMLRRASLVTTCGPSFAKTVERFAGLNAGSVRVVGFGVDTNLFRGNFQPQGRSDDVRRVGFFKGFRAVYGADRLIRAIPYVIERMPTVQFELVGDGAELTHCRTLAHSLTVDKYIRWLGRQEHAALPQLVSSWDATVVPSVHESFGVAVLESSAMGVPVVASDIEGLRDTVRHRETGLLVDTADPKKLAGAIIEILENDALRSRLSEIGTKMVEEEYDWSKLIKQWVQAYETALTRDCAMV